MNRLKFHIINLQEIDNILINYDGAYHIGYTSFNHDRIVDRFTKQTLNITKSIIISGLEHLLPREQFEIVGWMCDYYKHDIIFVTSSPFVLMGASEQPSIFKGLERDCYIESIFSKLNLNLLLDTNLFDHTQIVPKFNAKSYCQDTWGKVEDKLLKIPLSDEKRLQLEELLNKYQK